MGRNIWDIPQENIYYIFKVNNNPPSPHIFRGIAV